MADRLRVNIESIEDLGEPTYRLGDHVRQVKHKLADDDDILKDLVVQVGHGDRWESTKPFGVPADGNVTLKQVLFVKRPPHASLTVRVVKEHRIQKDALIGEGFFKKGEGRQRVTLKRGDKPRGVVILDVSDGITKPPPGAAGSLTSLPAGALKRDAPEPEASGVQAQETTGCEACIAGILDLITTLTQGAGPAFLAKKAREPGFIVLPSGLMYKVLKKGRGRLHPGPKSICQCNYTGKLVDGTTFDTTEGGPMQKFSPDTVIKGWGEAMQLMVEGDCWELVVPPALAYGSRGVGPIPPNSVLHFKIEIAKIASTVGSVGSGGSGGRP